MSLQNLVKKKKILSKEDKVLWDLFTKNLKETSNNIKKKVEKDISYKNLSKNFNDLKLGHGEALSKKNIRNFKKGNVFIEDKIDLHGYKLIDANNVLENFINQSIKDGKRLVLVITGKGKEDEGTIKKNILSWLNNKKLRNKILAINSASRRHGGEGAFYILLRKF